MTRLKRSTALAALPAVLVFIGLATPAAQAQVTWNYVGRPFTAGFSPELAGDSLNLSVTFDGPLLANQFQHDFSTHIVSFTLSDSYGFFCYTATNPVEGVPINNPACPNRLQYPITLILASFSTDSNGWITNRQDGNFFVVEPSLVSNAGTDGCVRSPRILWWTGEVCPLSFGSVLDIVISSQSPSANPPGYDFIGYGYDQSGNLAHTAGPGTWTTPTPANLTAALLTVVTGMNIQKQGTSLTDQLTTVLVDINHGTLGLACSDLQIFANHVKAQTGKVITTTQSAAILQGVQSISATLPGCIIK